MIVEFIIFSLVGKLIIFFVQTFPLSKLPIFGELFKNGKFLHDLVSCDLCLGFWVYLGLSFMTGTTITESYNYPPYVSEVVTAMFASFVMHMVTIGWNEKFGIINVNIE